MILLPPKTPHLLAVICFSLTVPVCTAPLEAADFPAGSRPFLEQHCFDCHDGDTRKGGLNLAELPLDPADPRNLAAWTKSLDRVVSGDMPPAKKPRPTPAEIRAFHQAGGDALTAAWAERHSTNGRTALRRLNPTEFENTLRDLLAAPWLQLREMLPPDPESNGFDNVAAAQEISYVQMARILDAVEVALDNAMQLRPEPQPVTVRTWFNEEGRYLGKDWKNGDRKIPEWVWFQGQPNSAQAPRRIRNPSPGIAGWYRFRVRCGSAFKADGQLSEPRKGHVASLLTGAKRTLGIFDVPEGPAGGIVEFTAWLHDGDSLEFFCATLKDTSGPKGRSLATDAIGISWFEIAGPYASAACEPETDPWPPASYRRLFGDLPTAKWTSKSGLKEPELLHIPDLTANKRGLRESFVEPEDMTMVVSKNPPADAGRLLREFMSVAYRGAVEESEVQRCLAFATQAIADRACFQDAMRAAYKAALCSPDFLYFQERPGRLDGLALASRLAYFCWRSLPDAALRKAAEAGDLWTDEGLLRELDRLLADPKSARFVSDFTGQWLDLRKINDTTPDRLLYPEYFCDTLVVESAAAETEATFAEMLRGDLPVSTVVTADFALVNERLAEVYGLDGVRGKKLRRVTLPAGSPHGGLLTQCSVMKVTANGLTTSPVLRGAWILNRLLGTPPPPPPPGAGAIDPDTRGTTTVREQLDQHRRVASCASCHVKIDPPGFALENFDVMGAWRDRYRSFDAGDPVRLQIGGRDVKFKLGPAVDATGRTEDGQTFNDIHDFRHLLLLQEEQIARNLVRRLLTFATGAGVTFADRPRVETVLRQTRPGGHGLRSMIREIVLSETFRSK